MGLLQDDAEWITSMKEVSMYGSAKQIRSTLAIILQYCQPTKPRVLFDDFLSFMSDDFVHKKRKETSRDTLDEIDMNDIYNCVLRALDTELGQMGSSLSEFPELPSPPPTTENENEARVLKEETFAKSDQELIVNQLEPFLNPGQAEACEAVYQAVHSTQGDFK